MSGVSPASPPPTGPALARIALRIAVVIAVVLAVTRISNWVMMQTASADGLSMAGFGVIGLILLAYALLIAVPFVPGVEIGAGLMLVLGAPIAPLVYVATLAGLLLAYAIGCWVSYDRLHQIFADFHMRAACRLLTRIAPLTSQQRLDLLGARLPNWLAPLATRYRYVTLALVINLPGNSLLGGGGGLSILAGLSRLYRPLPTLLTFVIAVAPVPLLVWMTGSPLTWFTG